MTTRTLVTERSHSPNRERTPCRLPVSAVCCQRGCFNCVPSCIRAIGIGLDHMRKGSYDCDIGLESTHSSDPRVEWVRRAEAANVSGAVVRVCSTGCACIGRSARACRSLMTSSAPACWPVQLRHGAPPGWRWRPRTARSWRLGVRRPAAYERIEAAVRADPGSREAQQHRAQLPRS